MEKVLYKFYAEWCGPCKMMDPIVAQFEEESGIKVKHINIEEDLAAAKEFNVQSIPTLVRVENGEEVARKTGFMALPMIVKFME